MDLAESYRVAGQYGPAITTFEQAYARTIELGRENTENAGTLYNNWALTLALTGQTLQAEALFRARDAHQQRRRHRQERLADGAHQPGDHADRPRPNRRGAALCRPGLRAGARRWRRGHRPLSRSLRAARVFRARGQYAQGMQIVDELEQQFRRAYPPECACFGTIASERGLLAAAHGDSERAMAEMDKAVAIAEGDKARPDVLPRIPASPRRGRACARPSRRRPGRCRAVDPCVTSTSPAPDAHSANLGLALSGRRARAARPGPTAEAAQALSSAVEHLRPTLGADHAQDPARRAAVDAGDLGRQALLAIGSKHPLSPFPSRFRFKR